MCPPPSLFAENCPRAINELHYVYYFLLVRRTLGKSEDFAELENFNKTLAAEEQGSQDNQNS